MATYESQTIVEAVERNDTSFGTRVADNTTNRLDLPAIYPFNTERHKITINGRDEREPTTSAKFTDQTGYWQLTASAGDTISFAARERLRYVPNYELLFGLVAWYESQPDADQRLFIELSDDARQNAYRYELTPGATEVSLVSGGATVDSVPESEFGAFDDADAADHNPFDKIERTQPINLRGKLNWYGSGNFRPSLSYTRPNGVQYNPTLGKLANQAGIATEEINLRPKIVLEADAGAADFTVNLGTIGALIRGNATEVDRPEPFVATDLGGTITGAFADNAPVVALRNDPTQANVVSEILPYQYAPGGSDVMELAAVVVSESDTDASGFTTPIIQNATNTALQATTQVTSFPTTTKTDIKGDSVTAPDPDRLLATVVAAGGGRNTPAASGTDLVQQKRVFDSSPVTDSEVVLLIPRQISGNDGTINWLKVPTLQDW